MSEDNKDLEGKDEKDQGNGGDWGDDDNFGLPDIEYSPLERTDEENDSSDRESTESETSSEPTSFASSANDSYEDEETEPEDFNISYADDEYETEDNQQEKKSSSGVIITIVSLVVLIGLVAGYLFWFKPMQDKKNFDEFMALGNAALEQKDFDKALDYYNKAQAIFPEDHSVDEAKAKVVSAKEEAARLLAEKAEADRLAAEEAERLRREAEAAKQPKEGTVERITSRTGRYYVVIASDIDGDLAMDYANKIAKEGFSSKIITPAEKGKYHRITIADFESAAEAQGHADSVKGTFSGAWIVKF